MKIHGSSLPDCIFPSHPLCPLNDAGQVPGGGRRKYNSYSCFRYKILTDWNVGWTQPLLLIGIASRSNSQTLPVTLEQKHENLLSDIISCLGWMLAHAGNALCTVQLPCRTFSNVSGQYFWNCLWRQLNYDRIKVSWSSCSFCYVFFLSKKKVSSLIFSLESTYKCICQKRYWS